MEETFINDEGKFFILTPDEFYFWLCKKDITLTSAKTSEDLYIIIETEFTAGQIKNIQSQLNAGLKSWRGSYLSLFQ